MEIFTWLTFFCILSLFLVKSDKPKRKRKQKRSSKDWENRLLAEMESERHQDAWRSNRPKHRLRKF